MINTISTQGLFIENWFDQINNIKAKFPGITDADLYFREGEKDEMLYRIQLMLGKTKEELAYIMSSF